MVRSIFLRGFDQECANRIGKDMDDKGVKFINESIPTKMEKLENGKIKVTWTNSKTKEGNHTKDFDTVICAVGRNADTSKLGLETIKVQTKPNGKIICKDDDSTTA